MEVTVHPCIYASQHQMWLDEAASCDPVKLVCFRSRKKWVRAETLLKDHATLPILFGRQDDPGKDFSCHFAADLVDVYFKDQFRNLADCRAWLNENLWLQRKVWQRRNRAHWESKFEDLEIKKFLEDHTWYRVQAMRKIRPLPLPRLRKLRNNQPLSPGFRWGYAICQISGSALERLRVGEPTV
jgi:hypothetical protein